MRDHGGAAPARHILGNYELFEEIGCGGMGIVYRALDLSLDRIVAVKILRDDLRAQPQIVSRFSREAKAAACLDHPNIVQIYSVGNADGTPYIAMEFVDAVPLSTLMQREANMDWREALDIAAQVASALNCAHDAQVIHRDIKPPNILITDGGRAFVTDFGIAKILTMDDNLTVDGSRLGTPHYMSPERCRNGQLTGSSDLYSLGVLLFQMLSGRLPYEAGSSLELIRKVVSEPPARLRQFRPDVPESVERLVAWMIEKNPKHRPTNGHAVCEAVERVRQGKPLDTGNSSMSSVLADFRHSFSRSAPVDSPQKLATGLTPIAEGLPRSWKRYAKPVGILAALLVVAAVGLVRLASGRQAIPTWDPQVANPELWQASAEVATFKGEAQGVLLARIDLPNVSVSQIGWAGSPSTLIVQLNGTPETHQEGRRVICGLNPIQRQASIVIPPELSLPTAAGTPQITALAFTGSHAFSPARPVLAMVSAPAIESAFSRNLYALPSDATRAAGAMRLGQISDNSQDQVEYVAAHPRGLAIAAAMTAPDHRSRLVQWRRAPDGTLQSPRTVLSSGPPITALQYSPDGNRLAVLREVDSKSRELWILSDGGASVPAQPLLRGSISLGEHAFHPDGTSIAISERRPEGRTVLRIVRVQDGEVEKELGDLRNASWDPSGTRIVGIAPDRKGITQLWALQTEPPFRRAQLTYLDDGVGSACALSADGVWVAGTIPQSGSTTLALVDTRRVSF